MIQVMVAAARNWNHPAPSMSDKLHEITTESKSSKDSEILQRTDQFRFLDRAAIAGGESPSPFRTCTVTQVEEAKILLRMSPIILSTVVMNICVAQLSTFSIHQALTLDTRLGRGFHIPAASLPIIPLSITAVLIPFYDRAFVPLARRLTGIPTGITHLQRIGVGLVLSAASMAAAAAVESRRKSVAVKHGMVDAPPGSALPMSVFWLGIQYAVFGAAELFSQIGLLDFFYSESPAGMKTLAMAISWCTLAFGYYGSSVVVSVVNRATGGWLANNNLNRDRLEDFYWLLAVMSVVNFGVYLVFASMYRYKEVAANINEKDEEA